MTYSNGRNGRKYNRANIDPRGSWAAGVPASGGFYPQRGIRFSGTEDPLCPPHAPCASTDEAGRTFAAIYAAAGACTPHAPCVSTDEAGRSFASVSHGMTLSRHGAQKTRLSHGLMKSRYSGAAGKKRR